MVAGAVALALSGCSQPTLNRIFDSIAGYSCIAAERLPGAEPCSEPVVTPEPLFCRQTLAGVECYAEENPFDLKPGWLRAAPPDIGG